MNSEQIAGGYAYGLDIRRMKPEAHTPLEAGHNENRGILNWPCHQLADLGERNGRTERPREYLNNASLSMISRRIIAAEWARARGRKSRYNGVFTLKTCIILNNKRIPATA
jgi:hypothetical protein